MVAQLQLNPYVTTTAAGTFNTSTSGFAQGMLLDNPVELFKIAGGIVAATETIPMWGGIAIAENIPLIGVTQPMSELGGTVIRAATIAAITGFSVFNMNYAMVNSPQSPVPLSPSGAQVNFVRIGSNTRLAVACDPGLVSLGGSSIAQQVGWDINNQRLAPYDASTPTYALSTITWANTNGGRLTVVASVATPVAAVGDDVNISGATNSGTGSTGVINTNFVVDTFTDNEHFTLAAPAAAGVFGTIAGSPVLNYATGALNVKLLQVQNGNSMVVVYDPVTGFATWNRSGTTAIILI
jgi:hypothetical protein